MGLGVFFPLLLGGGEFLGQLALGVPETGRLLILLAAHHPILLLLDLLDLLFDVDDLLGDVDVVEVDPASHLVQGVNGLVREVPIRDVPGGQGHAAADGLIGVVHRVVLLVLVLDVVQDLDGLVDAGRLHQHLLEAALEGSVLFDVLTVFVEGRGANALNLTTRQGGLEHVGGVQRTAGPTGTDNGVDLVDEQDDVQALFELVHHGLHALLKLATVLRAGHEGGDIEGDDPLAEQNPGDLLLYDADGEALGDGALSDARLTDEDGVVLLPAGQHLADALDFLFPADDGVELAFFGEGRQVPAEVVEDRRLALAVRFGSASASWTAGTRAALLFIVRHSRELRTGSGTAFSIREDALEFLFCFVVVDVQREQGLGGHVVFVFQNGEEKVFGSDDGALECLGLEVGDLQDFLGLLDERDVARVAAGDVGGRDAALDHFPKSGEVDVEPFQDADGRAFSFPDDAEQKMLHADVVVAQTKGLLAAVGDDVLHPG